jgi:hypothetical protein
MCVPVRGANGCRQSRCAKCSYAAATVVNLIGRVDPEPSSFVSTSWESDGG